ncbi:MAG: RNA-processing protein [Methanomicrobiales archaeon]|nr:RNA-processing protein [Methanomicrobiales archaeon]
MQRYWFGDVDDRGQCIPAPADTASLASRIASLATDMHTFVPLSVDTAIACGIANDREEYLRRLRNVCIARAEAEIALYYSQSDMELLQMVRMLDEMDTVVNLLTERATEWYIVRNPGFSRKYRAISAKKMVGIIKRDRSVSLSRIAQEIDRVSAARTALMRDVSARAEQIAPNSSALVGGLVAARLIAKAGGLGALARLPASTVQVIGAQNALFSHLRTRSPPPKHGIIFQHRRVHNAPKQRRGRVARVLAGKLVIAARLDYFRKEAVPAFIASAQERIDRAGEEP